MRRRSALRNAVEYAAAGLVVAALEWAPLPAANALGRSCARLLDLFVPRLRHVARRNLALALPELSRRERERLIDGVFRSIGRLLVSFARMPRIGRENVCEWIRYEGLEHFLAARARGQGVLVATAHLGNWELSAFAHAWLTEPMQVVVRPLDNPLIDRLVERRRALSGNRLIEKRDFARPLLKALKENQAVGILIDQNASQDAGVFVDFFGVPACAGTGFAKLAAHSRAAVVPGYAVWSEAERKYVLHFEPEVPMSGDAEADTQALQRRLEAAIRRYPDQWLWIHRRWKTRPPGAPSLY